MKIFLLHKFISVYFQKSETNTVYISTINNVATEAFRMHEYTWYLKAQLLLTQTC